MSAHPPRVGGGDREFGLSELVSSLFPSRRFTPIRSGDRRGPFNRFPVAAFDDDVDADISHSAGASRDRSDAEVLFGRFDGDIGQVAIATDRRVPRGQEGGHGHASRG